MCPHTTIICGSTPLVHAHVAEQKKKREIEKNNNFFNMLVGTHSTASASIYGLNARLLAHVAEAN